MALKLKHLCGAIVAVILAICTTIIFKEDLLVPRLHPSNYPKPISNYWGKDVNDQNADTAIYSFVPFESVKNTEDILDEYIHLWLKNEATNPFEHEKIKNNDNNNIDYNQLSIIKANGYGINYKDFTNLINYYQKSFHWNTKKTFIQTSFQHKMTKIQGLNIHFMRSEINRNKERKSGIDAIILLHGWPSSYWEYHKVLQLFEQHFEHRIDVIVPSLPGYGHSEYPMTNTGFDTAAVAHLLKELMEDRLNYNNYIVCGGDWGSVIAHNWAYLVTLSEEEVMKMKLRGMITTMPITNAPLHDLLLLALNKDFIHAYIANKYNTTVDAIKKRFSPLSKLLISVWDLTGYQHEHATRANTIGIVLQSSPISFLSWIYEKYLSWADSSEQVEYDGENRRVISGELTWDDVLVTNNIFWLNGKIPSGIRYYSESLWKVYYYMTQMYIPSSLKVGIIQFEAEAFNNGPFYKWHYHNIVMQKSHKKGGHFPGLEYPETLYNDIVEFIDKI